MNKFFPVLFCFFIAPAYAVNAAWFENFNDPVLTGYICEALEANKDVEIARKNILKYRQEKNLAVSKEFPEIDVGADYLLLKIPKSAIPRNDIQTNSFALPFITIWEIDYLGKNYNSIQKARLDSKNALLELEYTGLIVAADTADAYFNISSLNKQIEIQEKIKDSYQKTRTRKQKMFKNGVISALELNSSESALASEINRTNDLYKQREIFLTQLAYILGKSPYNLDDIKVSAFDKIIFTGVRPENFNGGIVSCRPDIIQKENELKKAKIDITIAKKEFLPRINILGIMVFSTIVQNFGWDGVFAALSAGATQNLFDGGKRIFTLKKRKIEYERALEEYLKAGIKALKEVNDSLYALKKDFEIYQNQKKISALQTENFVKIFKSYNEGARNYLEYQDENVRTLREDISLAVSKNRDLINLLSLYKAVGGAL